ncbi:MAG: Ribonuclease [Verrucomicrobia bacterium]|nr:Ribonuclease [Verrucomicrobiota bacterium]
MSPALDQLQDRIGYTFRDSALLEQAVTHPSWLQAHRETVESNQRLEFLGDAVLQLILTEALFQEYAAEREGALSQRRASLTKGPFLALLAREIGLEACLRLGGSEEAAGGRTRASALEDAFEGVIGAIYLDSDLPAVRRVVLGLYGSLSDRLALEKFDNPKGRLQEMIQPVHGNEALRYEVTNVEGADHAREYEVAVLLNSEPVGTGRGTSKKLAEEAAAEAALAALSARKNA